MIETTEGPFDVILFQRYFIKKNISNKIFRELIPINIVNVGLISVIGLQYFVRMN